MGKSTIAKAILNEHSIAAHFNARLFITYDGIASSSMTYQVFLDRIAEALRISTSTSAAILQFLQSFKALLVIDNAETFLEAPQDDTALMYRTLEDMGSQSATRIVLTTRNIETIPSNLPWNRIAVTGLDQKSALEAFAAVYPISPTNQRISQILSELEHHPLSINILANAAVMNEWDVSQLQKEWEHRKAELLDISLNDKYRSLRVTVELSISSFKDKNLALQILRAIAFLPQGIHCEDFHAISPSVANISLQIEAVRRSSLIYRTGGRLTMLAPIRIYIAGRYNRSLLYSDPFLSTLRTHYYGGLVPQSRKFIEREHANIDRLLYVDMSSALYHSTLDIHTFILQQAKYFLLCTSVQRTSLWPLLVLETKTGLMSQTELLAPIISLCLIRIGWADYRCFQYAEALRKLKFAEQYCREHIPACSESLVICLRFQGIIYKVRGDLALATNVLNEGSSIARSSNAPLHEAVLTIARADVLLLQGRISEADFLLTSSEGYLEANNEHLHLINLLDHRAHISMFYNDFTSARQFLDKALRCYHTHGGDIQRLEILSWKASCEGWAGDISAALRLLEENTKTEISPGMPQFSEYIIATRGVAYYLARLGRPEDARRTIAHAIEVQWGHGGESGNNFISACIECLLGEREVAMVMLQRFLDHNDGQDQQWTALHHRTLGEILIRQGRGLEARAQFEKAKAICHVTGISPRQMYVNILHWYTLPLDYSGWERYLDDTI